MVVRGAGHSCGGQTVTDGVQLLNIPDPAVEPVLRPDGRVEIDARSRWRDVEAFLNRRGRSIPVLADYLNLSVGGTLSVGGYGADSVVHGAQVDHVERLRLIAPNGRAAWCSPTDDAERFGFALAGLGEVGVIERVVMRTMPHRPHSVLFTYRHSSLTGMVASLAWLNQSTVERPHLFKANHSRGRFVSTYGMQASTLREALAARRRPPVPDMTPAHAWVAPRYRQWRDFAVRLWMSRFVNEGRLWSDYLFDYESLKAFAEFLEPLLLEDEPFRSALQSVYIVAVRQQPRLVRLPFEATDALPGPMSFGIGLYSMIPGRDAAIATRVAATVSRCLQKCIELGGRPYRYGWHELTPDDFRRIYGPAVDRLSALRATP